MFSGNRNNSEEAVFLWAEWTNSSEASNDIHQPPEVIVANRARHNAVDANYFALVKCFVLDKPFSVKVPLVKAAELRAR